MAITVNGKILRNLPEQVSKNTEDIFDLQEVTNNNEIRITALEQGAIALATFQDCTFTGTTAIQDNLSISAATTISGDVAMSGDLSVTGDASFTGSVSISNAASITATSISAATFSVSGNGTVSGNLAVTGNITGGSIIENMSGYTFTKLSDIAWNDVYIGAVKNGNKLTVVVFGSYNKQAGDPNNPSVCTISAPSAVMNKLVPFTIGSITNALDVKTVSFFSSASASVSIPMRIVKSANTLYYIMSDTSGLTNGVDYMFRYEATFLLSDKLN